MKFSRMIYAGCLFYLMISVNLLAQEVFNDKNMQPEVWHMEGPPKAQVDQGGDLNLSIPIMTVPGRGGLDFPITFSYHAPIKKNDRATWIGVGWNFEPGSITRDPQGGIAGHPGVDFTDEDVYHPQPDMYYVMIPGKGTQPFSRSNDPDFYTTFLTGQNFYPLNTQKFYTHYWQPWKIEATIASPGSINIGGYTPCDTNNVDRSEFESWIVTTEDGTRYLFQMPSLAWYRTQTDHDPECYVSVWRLVAILSSDCPYDELPTASTPGNWIRFEYAFTPPDIFLQTTYLWKIITPTHEAIFNSSVIVDIDNQDWEEGSYKRLNSIELFKTGQGTPIKKVVLNFDQSLCYEAAPNSGKTTLRSIDFYGKNQQLQPGYKFIYVNNNPGYTTFYLHDQCDDDFGYYDDGHFSNNFDTNADDADAWSLKTIVFPSGGSESYEYENDDIFGGFTNRTDLIIIFMKTGHHVSGRVAQG